MAASNSPSATSNSQKRESFIVSSASSATERSFRPVALLSLRGDKEFRKVRSAGAVIRDPLFTLRLTDYRPRYGETWRPRAIMGIVVPKKTLKRAVDRNRARRRVREALRTLPGGLPPCRAILMPNPAVLSAPFGDIQAALSRALLRTPKRAKTGSKSSKGNQTGQNRVLPVVPAAQNIAAENHSPKNAASQPNDQSSSGKIT